MKTQQVHDTIAAEPPAVIFTENSFPTERKYQPVR
jgi:hypothetical protein